MTVMRSCLYMPGNNETMVSKAPQIPADVITLDLEDSVPPTHKSEACSLVREHLEAAGSRGSAVYVRVNGWDTALTDDDPTRSSIRGSTGSSSPSADTPPRVSASLRDSMDWSTNGTWIRGR